MGRTPRPFSRWQLTLRVNYEKKKRSRTFFFPKKKQIFSSDGIPSLSPCSYTALVCVRTWWMILSSIRWHRLLSSNPSRFLLPCIYFNSGFIIRDGAKTPRATHAGLTAACSLFCCCCLVKEKILLISRSFGVERILSFALFCFPASLSLVFFHIKFPFDWSSSAEETRERDGATPVGRWCGRAFNPERLFFLGGGGDWRLMIGGAWYEKKRLKTTIPTMW